MGILAGVKLESRRQPGKSKDETVVADSALAAIDSANSGTYRI
jgi:hypothetical protein